MLGAVRSAARKAQPAVMRGVRQMSSGKINYAEEAKEAHKWKIISFAAIPVIIGMAVKDLSAPHPHEETPPPYPYLHIRNKDFPWGPDGLFETKHEH